jgi:hypothetical protein
MAVRNIGFRHFDPHRLGRPGLHPDRNTHRQECGTARGFAAFATGGDASAATAPSPVAGATPPAGEGDRPQGRGGPPGGGRRSPPLPTEIHQWKVVSVDRETGKLRWEKTVREEVPHEGHHATHGFASFSPVTDGEDLYAYFGSRGLYAFDLKGGLKWEKDFGDMRTIMGFGEGGSLALHHDTLVVNWDHEGDDFIAALDKRTGGSSGVSPRGGTT